jgi:putative heme-binding domain-containing protein
MDNGGLKPEIVVPLLLSADKRMKETALWIVSHNPEWGDSLAGFFRERLKEKTIPAQDQNEIAALIARFAGNASVQELLANALASDATPRDSKLVALKAMASSGLREAPASWTAALKTVLSGNDASLIPDALRVVRLIAPAKGSGQEMNEVLLRVAKADSRPANERLSALAAIRPALSTVEPRLFDLLRAHIAPNNSVETRDLATTVLAKAKLNSEQLVALADSVKEVGPMEVLKLLSAFEHSTDETVGLKLIASLKESKAASSLRADTLKPKLAKFPASVQTEADALLASLNTDAETQKKHIDELLPTLKGGDIRRGQTVFNSTKAACASCHRIGYLGGNVGPDLTSISQARNERDLLEAIVYPSATFVRSYEPVIVKTKSDEDYSGVLRRDAADEIVIATGPNTEVRIARAEITEMRPGAVSVMPAGLDQQLTKQELADLLAFLKRTKWDAN